MNITNVTKLSACLFAALSVSSFAANKVILVPLGLRLAVRHLLG